MKEGKIVKVRFKDGVLVPIEPIELEEGELEVLLLRQLSPETSEGSRSERFDFDRFKGVISDLDGRPSELWSTALT